MINNRSHRTHMKHDIACRNMGVLHCLAPNKLQKRVGEYKRLLGFLFQFQFTFCAMCLKGETYMEEIEEVENPERNRRKESFWRFSLFSLISTREKEINKKIKKIKKED